MLSVKAMINTLLSGSAGNFSRFTHELVTLIDGPQELSERLQLIISSEKNNRDLFMFEILID
jgi:hypothetical protein